MLKNNKFYFFVLLILSIVVNINLFIGYPVALIGPDSGYFLESAMNGLTLERITNNQFLLVGFRVIYFINAVLIAISFNNIHLFKFHEIILIFLGSVFVYCAAQNAIKVKTTNIKSKSDYFIIPFFTALFFISILSYSPWLEGGNLRENYGISIYVFSLYYLLGSYFGYSKISTKTTLIVGTILGFLPLIKEPFIFLSILSAIFYLFIIIRSKNSPKFISLFLFSLISPTVIMILLHLYRYGSFTSLIEYYLNQKVHAYRGTSSDFTFVELFIENSIRNIIRIISTPFGVFSLVLIISLITWNIKTKSINYIIIFSYTLILSYFIFLNSISSFFPHYLLLFIPGIILIFTLYNIYLAANLKFIKIFVFIIFFSTFSVNMAEWFRNYSKFSNEQLHLEQIINYLEKNDPRNNSSFVNINGPHCFGYLVQRKGLLHNFIYYDNYFRNTKLKTANQLLIDYTKQFSKLSPDYIYFDETGNKKYARLFFNRIKNQYKLTKIDNLYKRVDNK